MNIIKTALGVEYRQQEFIDAWGRSRICFKRLSNLPQPHKEACAVCGKMLEALRSTKRFCGPACKMRHHRQNKSSSAELF